MARQKSADTSGLAALEGVAKLKAAVALMTLEEIEKVKKQLRGKRHTAEQLIELCATGLVAGERLRDELEVARRRLDEALRPARILAALASPEVEEWNVLDLLERSLSALAPEDQTLTHVRTIVRRAAKDARSGAAREAAKSRHEQGPMALARGLAAACGREWDASPTRYKSSAAFARDMVSKIEELIGLEVTEVTVIRWERERRRQLGSGSLPAE
jgi:hypothetical protein